MLGSCSPDEPGISIFSHEFPALWEEEARESNAKPHLNRVLLHCSRIPYRSFGRSRVLHSDWTKTGGGPGQSPSKSFFSSRHRLRAIPETDLLDRKKRCPSSPGYTWLSTWAPSVRALITFRLSPPGLAGRAPKPADSAENDKSSAGIYISRYLFTKPTFSTIVVAKQRHLYQIGYSFNVQTGKALQVLASASPQIGGILG